MIGCNADSYFLSFFLSFFLTNTKPYGKRYALFLIKISGSERVPFMMAFKQKLRN
jgi:hypothetical protein